VPTTDPPATQPGNGERALAETPTHWIARRPAEPLPEPRRRLLRSVASVARVVFATEAGPTPRPRVNWLCAEVEDYLDRAGTRSRLVFRGAMLLVMWLSPLLVFRPPPLWLWALPIRARALERLERTPLALALFALKAVLCIPYYEHPDAAAEIGFDGHCLVEEGG